MDRASCDSTTIDAYLPIAGPARATPPVNPGRSDYSRALDRFTAMAGGLVALIPTIERRELRDVPLYGVLANHSTLTIAAICGGIVMHKAKRDGGGLRYDRSLS